MPHAQRAGQSLGVHPMALVAQAALESGWGARMPRRADGHSSNNLFGIKAGADWKGARAVAHTLEFERGLPVRRAEAFRAYPDLAAAFDDYARLIGQGGRYAEARAAGLDAAKYLNALQAAGYATDPAYAQKVGRVLASLNVEVNDG